MPSSQSGLSLEHGLDGDGALVDDDDDVVICMELAASVSISAAAALAAVVVAVEMVSFVLTVGENRFSVSLLVDEIKAELLLLLLLLLLSANNEAEELAIIVATFDTVVIVVVEGPSSIAVCFMLFFDGTERKCTR